MPALSRQQRDRGGAGAAVIPGRGDVNHSPRSPGRMRPRAPSLPHASRGPQALSSAGWKRLAARTGMGWGRCSSWDAGSVFPAPASGWDEGAVGCGCLLHPGSHRGSSLCLGCILIAASVVKRVGASLCKVSWRVNCPAQVIRSLYRPLLGAISLLPQFHAPDSGY